MMLAMVEIAETANLMSKDRFNIKEICPKRHFSLVLTSHQRLSLHRQLFAAVQWIGRAL